MAASDFTKQHIAQAMKELLQSRSFASVSVSDLTRQCGVGRNTFYYHFHDKYEVVSWIFFEEIAPLLSRFDRLENWTGGLSELCLYLQKNRDFYIRVLEFEGQNSFCQCLTEFYRKLVYDLLCQNGGQSVTERQMRSVARFVAAGIVEEIQNWARNGMESDPTAAIGMLRELFSGQLIRELRRQPGTPAECAEQ